MLRFNEEDHTYFLDEVKIPSVSELLIKIGVSKPYTGDPYYGDRGSRLHLAIYEYFTFGIKSFLDEDIQCFFDNFLKFVEDFKDDIEFLEHEKRGYFKKGEIVFAGTTDLICNYKGVSAVLDYKTCSKIYKPHYYQLDAYREIFGVEKMLILQLRQDDYVFREVKERYKNVFLPALEACNEEI